jgi:hypothetical protein
LNQSLLLFKQQGYEDERLGEHAKELLAKLNAELGGESLNGDQDGDGEEWEDEENEASDEDEDMAES